MGERHKAPDPPDDIDETAVTRFIEAWARIAARHDYSKLREAQQRARHDNEQGNRGPSQKGRHVFKVLK
jgi:ribosomal 50S subunit-associated protein YjgA (DUF615 family)